MSWESRADRIDRDLPIYVWSQIADDLRADIDSGELTPGQRLPSGPELAEIYGVTKVTATKAIRHLPKREAYSLPQRHEHLRPGRLTRRSSLDASSESTEFH